MRAVSSPLRLRGAAKRWCGLALILVGLCGCSTVTTVSQVGQTYPANTAACSVKVLDQRDAPVGSYKVVAQIESHMQRDIFFGGKVSLRDDAYKELRSKACQLGGDVVRIDDSLESSAAEMSHVHVWATVFRTAR